MTDEARRQIAPPAEPSPWGPRTVIIRDWVQILAVIAAAGWGYFHFRATEAPAGVRNFGMTQELDWERVDSSSCYAVLKGGVENLSSSGIKITRVGWKVWLIDRPPLVGPIAYQNPDAWASTVPIDSLTYSEGPFVQEYPPRAKTEYALTWRVRRKPGLALFKVELFPAGSDRATDWIFAWDEICNGV